MSSMAIYILCVLIGAAVGAGICYVWASSRINVMHAQATVAEQKADLVSKHQELTVQVVPYVCTSKSSGWWSRSKSVEVGYQYQLFIRGLPCFEPHRIVTETSTESEVSEAGLELLRNRAAELAQAALLAIPEGRAAKLITMAATQVTRRGR